MSDRFSRQSFLGEDSEHILGMCRVAIVGLGGGGSHLAQQLAHIGAGHFLLIDDDICEESNLNRLVGATYDDVLKKIQKTEIAERVIKGINPGAIVKRIDNRWEDAAIRLRDADVIFGCVDTFAARRDLEITARRYLIPYIDIGMDVHPEGDYFRITGQVILSMPGQPCMRCLGFLADHNLAREAAGYGAAGSKPQVVWPNGALASQAIGVFVQLVTPWHNDHRNVVYIEYDGNKRCMRESNRLLHVDDIVCHHFLGRRELGDPFWKSG